MLALKIRRMNFQNRVNDLKNDWERSKRKNSANSQGKNFEKQWFHDNAQVISRYIEEVHFINTPEDFPAALKREFYKNYASDKNSSISFVTLDSIVRSCEKWLPYLEDRKSFELLVCLEVLSMAKIHSSVISARNIYQKQVAEGVRIKEGVSIPSRFTTIVTFHGNLEVYS